MGRARKVRVARGRQRRQSQPIEERLERRAPALLQLAQIIAVMTAQRVLVGAVHTIVEKLREHLRPFFAAEEFDDRDVIELERGHLAVRVAL